MPKKSVGGNKARFEIQYADIMSWSQFKHLVAGRPRTIQTYEYLAGRLGISRRRAYGWYDAATKEMEKETVQ